MDLLGILATLLLVMLVSNPCCSASMIHGQHQRITDKEGYYETIPWTNERRTNFNPQQRRSSSNVVVSNDHLPGRIKRQQQITAASAAARTRPVPRPGSLSRPTIRVPPTTQEQQLRQRNDVLTRVFEEEEQQKSQRNEVTQVGADENFREPLGLSSGAFALLGNVQSSFRCEGRPYGYYADVESSCRVFHVCLPIVHDSGSSASDEALHWSFFCGAETVFDQSTLTCVFADDAVPCSEAEGLYESVNGAFGRITG